MQRIYFLNDHKAGYKLTGGIAHILNKLSRFRIIIKTFYRFWEVNDTEKWIVFTRHPYEIITSGYFYHKSCLEKWANTIDVNLYEGWTKRFPAHMIKKNKQVLQNAVYSKNGVTYSNKLQELSQEDGILYEMENVGALTIMGMYEWKFFDKPNVLTIKFEDFITDFDNTIRCICHFIGFNKQLVQRTVQACKHLDLNTKTAQQILTIKHVTNKKRSLYRYKEVWSAKHYQRVKQLFPDDLLVKLGYST